MSSSIPDFPPATTARAFHALVSAPPGWWAVFIDPDTHRVWAKPIVGWMTEAVYNVNFADGLIIPEVLDLETTPAVIVEQHVESCGDDYHFSFSTHESEGVIDPSDKDHLGLEPDEISEMAEESAKFRDIRRTHGHACMAVGEALQQNNSYEKGPVE